MVLSLPHNVVWRLLGAMAVHCFLVFLAMYIICGNENPIILWRRTLLEERSPARGACYLFSKEDRMIEWRDIEEHANEARIKGWRVSEIIFQGSGHCAHLVMDEEKYIEAVSRVWGGD